MKEIKKDLSFGKTSDVRQKTKAHKFITRFKWLHGSPHYVAMGMAIGVFVGVTPTFPFHTFIAIALAFVLRGSKVTAAIGVWFGNPLTIPFFYVGSYKIGTILLDNSYNSLNFDMESQSILEYLRLGLDVTTTMIIGGVILGFLPGVFAYFITRKVATIIQLHKKTTDEKASSR